MMNKLYLRTLHELKINGQDPEELNNQNQEEQPEEPTNDTEGEETPAENNQQEEPTQEEPSQEPQTEEPQAEEPAPEEPTNDTGEEAPADDTPSEEPQTEEPAPEDDFNIDSNPDNMDIDVPEEEPEATPDTQSDAGGAEPQVDTGEEGDNSGEVNPDAGGADDPNLDIDDGVDDGGEGGGEDTGGGDDNFDIDASGDDVDTSDIDGGNEEGGEGNDTTPASDTGTSDPNSPEAQLQQMEDQLFNSLTDEEKNLKKRELKGLFGELSTSCDNIIEKVSTVPKTDDNSVIFGRISNNLEDIKTYARYYLEELFDNHTYIENKTYLQKLISILNGIKSVLNQLNVESDEK